MASHTQLNDHMLIANENVTNLYDSSSSYSLAFLTLHILTFVLNFSAGLILWRLLGLEKNVYHLVVRTLVLSDTVSSLGVLIPSSMAHVSSKWVGGQVACTVFGYISTMFLTWSAFLVFILCAMRYLAVCQPFFYREHVKIGKVRVVLALALFWAALHLLLPAVGVGKYKLYLNGFYCAYDISHFNSSDKVLIHITVWEGLLFSGVILYFSTAIVLAMRQRRKLSSSISGDSKLSARNQKWVQLHQGYTIMTLFIVAIFLLCNFPFLVLRLKVIFSERVDEKGHFAVQVVASLNPLLNPIVYIALNRKYRTTITNIVRYWSRKSGCFIKPGQSEETEMKSKVDRTWTANRWGRPKSHSMTKILETEECNENTANKGQSKIVSYTSCPTQMEGKSRGASVHSMSSVQFDNVIVNTSTETNRFDTPL